MTRTTAADRTTIDLDGRWCFSTDPHTDGRIEEWYDPDTDWPESAHEVEIPHAWQEHEAYRDYTGTAWYRRTVEYEPPTDGRTLLQFGAADYETTVWVNGERVGSNQDGYLPFEFDVTNAVIDGENTIVAAVDDPEDINEIPHGKQGAPWYQRVSGIWQSVILVTVPAVRVKNLRVTPDLDDDTATMALRTTAAESDTETAAANVIVSREGDEVSRETTPIETDGTASTTVTIENPDYWTPETPALYDVRIVLEVDGEIVDRYEDYFGMRSIDTGDDQLYLNGEPYYIRGALDQAYYPETLYRPFDDSVFEHEIRTAKQLGFNLLRKHIKPAHPDFLELADRLGILVWEEPANPTVCTERSKREVRDQIHGLVDRDYNHPSVVVWSLYNEEWGIGNPQGLDEEPSLWDDTDKQDYLADLYWEVKDRDPTRLVCDNSGWAHVATDLNDYHEYFVSPDRAEAWTEDIEEITANPEANYGTIETDPESTPLLVSEFGTWGLCDLPTIKKFYGGEPPWFDHDFLENPLKRPAGAAERFDQTTLSDVFEDWSSLSEAWQRREHRSNKDVIQQMRTDEGVAGYVITEFSDIEWEFNGLLDHQRNQKVFHDDFARINDDVLVSADLDSHAVRAGETIEADLFVRNDTTEAVCGTVEWSVFDGSGEVPVECNGFGLTRVENAISVKVPDVDGPTTDELSVSLPGAPTNREIITAVPEPSVKESITVYTDHDSLAETLAATGFEVVAALSADPDVALLIEPDSDVRAYAEDGGAVVCLPDADGFMADEEFFEYRALPEEESWNLVSSLFYTAGGAMREYMGDVPGWELEGLYPYAVADVSRSDDVQVGYVEGWLANWSAAVVVREHGEGRVGAFTFRVTGGDDQPVGTAVLVALVRDLGTTNPTDDRRPTAESTVTEDD